MPDKPIWLMACTIYQVGAYFAQMAFSEQRLSRDCIEAAFDSEHSPRLFELKRLALLLLIAMTLPVAALADSTPVIQSGGDKLSQSETATGSSAVNTAPGQFKAKNAAIERSIPLASLPEPGTLCLLGTALLGLAGLMRRKLRSKEPLAGDLIQAGD